MGCIGLLFYLYTLGQVSYADVLGSGDQCVNRHLLFEQVDGNNFVEHKFSGLKKEEKRI